MWLSGEHPRDGLRVVGIVVAVRMMNTRRGRMCAVTLDDGTAQLEVAVFGEVLERRRAMLKEDALLFVAGRARFDEFAQRVSISADQVMDLAQARALARAELRIAVEGSADVSRLRALLDGYRVAPPDEPEDFEPADGGCRVVVSFTNGVGCADLRLPEGWRVRPDDQLISDLRSQPRVRRVELRYA